MNAVAWFRSLPIVALPVLGCAAEIPVFDDDPRAELCGGSVCFPPDHVEVRRWGDGNVVVAAYRAPGCDLPRAGRNAIAGHAIVLELHRARPGARLPIVGRDRALSFAEEREPYAVVRAVRVDPETGRALADEEGVSGEAVVLDLDASNGRVRVRVRARWSSGVTGELLLDVEGWEACRPSDVQ